MLLVADERGSTLLYSFEDFSFDTERRELRRGRTLLALEPQVFDILEHLIRNRERVVSKDDLLASVWNGRIVSESTLSSRINAARAAIGDSGQGQRLIRTVSRKGIRFIGVVREEEDTVRKLAAIFAADFEGYGRMMGQDEIGAPRRLTACRVILDELIAAYRGRIIGGACDSVVADFANATDAVQCAVAVQDALAKDRTAGPAGDEMRFSIGVHAGELITQGENLFGDGVNIAARLEALAEPDGICISGTVRDDIGTKLSIAFTDLGEQQVKNIAQPIRVYRVHGTSTVSVMAPSLPLPDKPSIAVLPFQNMSGDPEQDYFADGTVEEIITALSHYPSLFVIARNSCFTYKGRAVDVRQVGRELGVHYVLEGSVRKAGYRIRVSAQIVEAETGKHVWAQRYDRDLAGIFAVQDEIAEAVTVAVTPAIAEAELHRAMRKRPGSLDAWAAYQRGLWHLGKVSTCDYALAQKFFQEAIVLDPTFGGGYRGIAFAQFQEAAVFQTRGLHEAQIVAETLARRAVALDGTDAEARSCLGQALWARGELDGMLAEAKRALTISPNLPLAHGLLGAALVFSGQPLKGVEALQTSNRLDPRDCSTLPLRLNQVALALYFAREYEAATHAAQAGIRSHPDFPLTYRWLAAALGQLGRWVEAEKALEKAVAIAPASFDMYVRNRVPWMRPEDHAHMLEGLRKAGWES